MTAIERVDLIIEVLKDHRQQHGIRDLDVHCLCGWSGRSHANAHLDHQARHIATALAFAEETADDRDR